MPYAPFPDSTILGYPRIGPRRELKRAVEAYWAGRSGLAELREVGRRLRADSWREQAGRGLAGLPSNTFSGYDQVLDTAQLLGVVPERYRRDAPEDTLFAAARGADGVPPLRMTKWFDTNYHYLVPEIGPDTVIAPDATKPLAELAEARALGYETRPVLVGPVTFLLLSEPAPGSPAGFTPLDRLDDVVAAYARVLADLAAAGARWVQLDEPSLVTNLTKPQLAAVTRAYQSLATPTTATDRHDRTDRDGRHDRDGRRNRPALFVATYFGDAAEALPALAATPVEAVGLDLVRGGLPAQESLAALAGRTLVAGVVSGRDVWRTDRRRALDLLAALRDRHDGPVTVATSCSLLHVPYDLAAEPDLPADLTARLAFAAQKIDEVVALATDTGPAEATPVPTDSPALATRTGAGPAEATRTGAGPAEAGPAGADSPAHPVSERSPYAVRAVAQAEVLGLPALPVTTIGSFPQTGELRATRAGLAAGRIDRAGYERLIEVEIERVIRLQEKLGLDVLVHGEPERNDMVQYFAEHLDGFAVTRNGWVQSYGSRCTRPPILHGDVSRPAPITVRWASYARSLTDRPVKGMLTGPVTIVAWSFVRDDRPLPEVVHQVADAVRGEVADLEAAGIPIIQVDEPALRELLPLRAEDRDAYLAWSVAAYRHATSGAGDRTQIHTHLCYSDAEQVLSAIDGLDADVTSIESARSHGQILDAVRGFGRGLGPGVYDIHSPRVPPEDEVLASLRRARESLGAERLWVNPDCGLKTRGYAEVTEALANLVSAARRLR